MRRLLLELLPTLTIVCVEEAQQKAWVQAKTGVSRSVSNFYYFFVILPLFFLSSLLCIVPVTHSCDPSGYRLIHVLFDPTVRGELRSALCTITRERSLIESGALKSDPFAST